MSRRFLPLVLVPLVALVACSGDNDAVAPALEPATSPDPALAERAPVYIVMFHADVDAVEAARDISTAVGVRPRLVWPAVRGFSAVIPEARLGEIRSDPRVAVVSPNFTVSVPDPVRAVRPAAPRWCPDDPTHPACQDKEDPGSGGQVTPWGITRVRGPGQQMASGRAWVIDTGVDPDHPDLNVDPDCSANFVTRGSLTITDWEDGHGHGTHVSGTIAAIDNDRDVVGVSPGATVCAIRVLHNSGSGLIEWVIAGVDYVAANGTTGDVANMSLGGGTNEPRPNALEQAILAAADPDPEQNPEQNRILFTLAAGNYGTNSTANSPGRIGDLSDNVYTISAIGQDDCLASWSSWGAFVDYAEPGVDVLSTKNGGGTTTMSGTSMAAPHMAGLLLQGDPGTGGYTRDDCGFSNPDRQPYPIGVLQLPQ